MKKFIPFRKRSYDCRVDVGPHLEYEWQTYTSSVGRLLGKLAKVLERVDNSLETDYNKQ